MVFSYIWIWRHTALWTLMLHFLVRRGGALIYNRSAGVFSRKHSVKYYQRNKNRDWTGTTGPITKCWGKLRVRFFKKIQDWILKSERIRKWILRSLLNRLIIQDLSDHDASKEPRNPFPEWILRFVWLTWSWTDLPSKETQNPFRILSDLKILEETHPQLHVQRTNVKRNLTSSVRLSSNWS